MTPEKSIEEIISAESIEYAVKNAKDTYSFYNTELDLEKAYYDGRSRSIEAEKQKDELIKLQSQYIKWLEESVRPAESMAFIHGFVYDVAILDEGVKIRNEITNVKQLLNNK